MRLYEFQQAEDDLPDEDNAIANIANLITVLNFVVKRVEDEDASNIINTQSLLSMVENTGIPFDYAALVSAYESNTAVKNLISNFNQDEVTLIGGPEDEMIGGDDEIGGENSSEAISRIAKRVAQRDIG